MSNLGLRDIPLKDNEEESLGLSAYIDSLSEFIQKCETPMTVALQGDWGSGKTSMMNLIKINIKKNPDIETIWFNTWQFSQFGMEDDLPVSLLSSFTNALGAGEDVKKVLSGLGKRIFKFLPMAGSLAGGDIGKELAEKIRDMALNENNDTAQQISKLKKGIEDAVNKKISNNINKRLVVFVDDLDRLLPERAVELLEVFKLFLDVPGCVYILACDYQVVSQGLKKKFGVGSDELKGKSFFDKIIQLPFSMPLGQYEVNNYIERLLKKIEFEYHKEDIDSYVAMINYSVGFNPRSMKRLFNSLLLLNLVAEKKNIFDNSDKVATKSEKQRILFGVLCLQTAYEPVYRYIQRNKDKINKDFFETIKNEEEFQGDNKYEEIRNELNANKDNSILMKLALFMENLINSIQLASDSEDIEKKVMSDKEIETFNKIISFSSLTSTDAALTPENIDSVNRTKNRTMAKGLIKELNEHYEKELKRLDKSNTFLLYQEQKSPDAFIYLDINTEPQNWFRLVFAFGNKVDGKNKKYISLTAYTANQTSINIGKKWFKDNCSDVFRDIEFIDNKSFVKLFKKEFSPDISFDDRAQEFKQMVLDNLNILFPKFIDSFGGSIKTT